MRIALPERLQASEVEGVVERLRAALGGEPLEVDVSPVTKVDTAGVQVLVSLMKTASQSSQTISLVGSSQSLSSAVDALGLTDHVFGDQAEQV